MIDQNHIDEIARRAFSTADLDSPMRTRYLDLARDYASGRREAPNDAVAAYLDQLQDEAEKQEADVLAARLERTRFFAEKAKEHKDRIRAENAPPEGHQYVTVKDERTGAWYRLTLPADQVEKIVRKSISLT